MVVLRGKKLRQVLGNLPVHVACDLLDNLALLYDPKNQRVDMNDPSFYYHDMSLERAHALRQQIMTQGISTDPLGVVTYEINGQRYNVFPGKGAADLTMACLGTQIQVPIVSRGHWRCIPGDHRLVIEDNRFSIYRANGVYRSSIGDEDLAAIYRALGVRA